MTSTIVRFVDLLLMSLLVGTMFGIWLGFNPSKLSAATYIEQQQGTIRAFNTLLPLLGAACVLLTAAMAVLTKNDLLARYLFIAAAVLLAVAGVITRFANQPINVVVMTWSGMAPPANWTELRDTWWSWHIARTVAGVAALILTLLAALGGKSSA
jgi:uncharacterized membrane protein